MEVQIDVALRNMENAIHSVGQIASGAVEQIASGAVEQIASDAIAMGGTEVPLSVPVAASGIKGYSQDIFEKGAEKFLCVYCKNVLRNPMQSRDCGHRFCKNCQDEMRSLNRPVYCLACQADEDLDPSETVLDLNAMFPDKAAIREMKKLKVKCPNPGCDWAGEFQYYQDHEDSCEHKQVTCSQCGELVSKGILENHQTEKCPKRLVECPNCKQSMTFDEQEKHKDVCPNSPIKCDLCKKPFPRNEMERHNKSECTHREIECPCPDCKVKMPRYEFSNHFTKNPDCLPKHMLFLYEQITLLTSKIDRLSVDPAVITGTLGGAAALPYFVRHDEGSQASEQSSVSDGSGAEGEQVPRSPGQQRHIKELQQKLKLHEDLMSVLHGEILRCIQHIEALSKELEGNKKFVVDGNNKVQALSVKVDEMARRIEEVNSHVNPVASTTGTIINSNDGSVVWRIDQFSQVRRAAVNEEKLVHSSPSFNLHPMGYKMRLRLFPNGDGDARGNAMSVFMQLQKGDCDELVPWPFLARVYMMLVDQKEFRNHIVDSFQTRPNLQAFKRPTGENNPASGCQSLVTMERLAVSLPTYVIKDTIFIKVLVDFEQQVNDRITNLDPKRTTAARR